MTAPVNDNLADRLPLDLGTEQMVYIADATVEAEEDIPGYFNSIWYEFTPTHDMLLGFPTLFGNASAARWWVFTGTTYDALTPVAGPLRSWPISVAVELAANVTYVVRLATTSDSDIFLTWQAEEYEWTPWAQDPDVTTGSLEPVATAPGMEFSGSDDYGPVINSDTLAEANNLTDHAFNYAMSVKDPEDDAFIGSPTSGDATVNSTPQALHTFSVQPVHVTTGDAVSTSGQHLGNGVYLAPITPPVYESSGTLVYESENPTMVSAQISLTLTYGFRRSPNVTGAGGQQWTYMYLLAANNNVLHHPYSRRQIYTSEFPEAAPEFATVSIVTSLDATDLAAWAPGDGLIFYSTFTAAEPMFVTMSPGDYTAVEYRAHVTPNRDLSNWTYRPPRHREQRLPVRGALAARRIFGRSDGLTHGAPRVLGGNK